MKLFLSLCILLFTISVCFGNNFYYAISWEKIECKKAPCPQYTIHNLNSAETRSILCINIPAELKSYEQYLTFNESNSVIVYGNIVANPTYPSEAFDLNILKAFKKLPLGNQPESTDKFYLFTDSGIRCIKAPCPSIKAVLANIYTSFEANQVVQPYQHNVGPFFDSVWLSSKTVRSDDQGLIGQGTIDANGTVIISNSYVRIPDPATKCPTLPMLKCQANSVVIYSRDENRCLTQPKCVQPGICSLAIPVCPNGYRLDSYKGNSGGCNSYKCDAYFLSKTH